MATKFNKYAVELDKAFRTAAAEYKEAVADLKAAQEQYNRVFDRNPHITEKYFGEREVIRTRTAANLKDAQHRVSEVARNAWSAYESTVAQLDKQLRQDVEDSYHIDPAELDNTVVTMMESGIVNADDMARLIGKYNSNPTMLKVITQYAKKAADRERAAGNADIAAQYGAIGNTTAGYQKAVISAWDDLKYMANTYSGNSRNQRATDAVAATDYMCRMIDQWDNVSGTIENF